MKQKSKAQQLQALYRELPTLTCKRRCQRYCSVIAMTREERAIIVKATGRAPHATPGPGGLTCSLLTADGLCGAYEVRPLVCRLWGLTPRMKCPYGCAPARWLTDEECHHFFRRVGEIGGRDKAWMKDIQRQLAAQGIRL